MNFRKLFAFAISMGAASLPAAELTVPGTHATVEAALAAANNGDTIRITADVLTTGSLVISKSIRLIPDPNRTLTVMQARLRTEGAAGGAQIGSVDGGLIMLDGTGVATTSNIIEVTTTTSPVRFENIRIDNAFNTTVRAVRILGAGGAEFRKIDCRGAQIGVECADANAARDSEFTFTNCRFVGMRQRSPIYVQQTNSNFTFRYCELEFTLPTSGAREAISIYTNYAGTITFDHCWIKGLGGATNTWPNFEIRPAGPAATINLTRCAIVGKMQGYALGLRNTSTNNVTLNIDHCDIIDYFQNAGNTSAAVFIGTGTDRKVTITNSNLVSLAGTNGVGFATAGAGDLVVMRHSNIATTGTAINGAANMTIVNNTAGLTPGYADVDGGNFTYANAQLKTAGEGGLPIGSNYNFANILDAVPVSRTQHWLTY